MEGIDQSFFDRAGDAAMDTLAQYYGYDDGEIQQFMQAAGPERAMAVAQERGVSMQQPQAPQAGGMMLGQV